MYGVQHGPSSIPWLGGLPHTVEASHAVPLPVLQFSVEGVSQHQNTVVQVEVGHLFEEKGKQCLNAFLYFVIIISAAQQISVQI